LGVRIGFSTSDGVKDVATRFDALVREVLSVPREEIARREADYKSQSALNSKKRRPRPKIKPSGHAEEGR